MKIYKNVAMLSATILLLNCTSVSANVFGFDNTIIRKKILPVEKVSVGQVHMGAITTDGDLYVWGMNRFSVLGIDESLASNSLEPRKVLSNVDSFDAGMFSSMAVTVDGSLYSWGSNQNGVSGCGDSSITTVTEPTYIMNDIKESSTFLYLSSALDNEGNLYQWGFNPGIPGSASYSPQLKMTNVIKTCSGMLNGAAITDKHKLYVWGSNAAGQLGIGDTKSTDEIVYVMDNVVDIKIGSSYCVALTLDGEVYAWGMNTYGNIGNGTTDNVLEPTKIMEDVKAISVGAMHTAAIKNDGSLYMWGYNSSGQLGIGKGGNEAKPVKAMDNVAYVDLCSDLSAAVTENQELYVWGAQTGALFNGSSSYLYTPTLRNIYKEEQYIENGIELNGFQISTASNGVRTIYSVEPEIDGQEVVEKGLVYGLKDYVTEDNMEVESTSKYVASFASTEEKGLSKTTYTASDNAGSYIMTLLHQVGETSIEGLTAGYYVRAYAKLADGSYTYSDVKGYSVFDLAEYFYTNKLMNNETQHNYLYDKILSVVKENYEKIEFDVNNSLVK